MAWGGHDWRVPGLWGPKWEEKKNNLCTCKMQDALPWRQATIAIADGRYEYGNQCTGTRTTGRRPGAGRRKPFATPHWKRTEFVVRRAGARTPASGHVELVATSKAAAGGPPPGLCAAAARAFADAFSFPGYSKVRRGMVSPWAQAAARTVLTSAADARATNDGSCGRTRTRVRCAPSSSTCSWGALPPAGLCTTTRLRRVSSTRAGAHVTLVCA